MNKSRKLLLTCLSSMMFFGPAHASNIYYVDNATVEIVTVLQLAASGHLAGNLEIQIGGGYTFPSGASCDHAIITTLKSVDADKRMMALLMTAQATKQRVSLHITDDPAYTAFGGRCSLVAVTLKP